MKNLLLAGVLSCALATSACQNTGPSIDEAAFIQDVQAAAELACAVAPTALTITAIIQASAAGTALVDANQIAALLCKQVLAAKTTAAAKRKAMPVMRGGVISYGTITINGTTIPVNGIPVQ